MPLWGHLSDVYGCRRLIMLGCGVMVPYPFAYFAMIDSGVFAPLAVAVILSGPVQDMQFSRQAAFIAETFPGSRRYSGVSLGFQLASITAGGPAPTVALYLFETLRTFDCDHQRRARPRPDAAAGARPTWPSRPTTP